MSTYRNTLSLALTFSLVIAIHLVLILPLYLKSRKYGINSNFKHRMEPIFLFFTFTIYIRLLLESYVLVSLSSSLELWNLGPNEAIVILFIVMVFTGLIIAIWGFTFKPTFNPSTSYFKECFSGIKQTKVARFYFSTFIIRRLFSVMIIVAFQNLTIHARVIPFAAIHVGVFIYTLTVRPFVGVKDNLIEALNDFTFGVFCSIFTFKTDETHWNDNFATFIIIFLL